MFLRSLTIRGFKSFADKTVLDFAPGISVIVGPNGSGKSNLVDAISWVLGEQGPRALRGGQMADVIFAGSPGRPALGMAEVKLVIDNTAGLIPVPMTEIEVSRTIFRSGESEYRIGGQVCRLMDVQELLSETGIGRALHTVVGQGQLEDVLSARPEERRQYIEEAAGIAKHRKRKERSERKLAGLDQDLLRLQDVLAELRRQLKPLRQQADMAQRHEELSAEAERGAARLAAARLRDLLEMKARHRSGWDEGLELRRQARVRLDELDERVGLVADERARAVWALQEAEAALQAAQTEKSTTELGLRETVERESAAKEALAAEGARAARMDAVREEIERAETGLRETGEALAATERELEVAERGFLAAQEARREVEEERRRIGEEAAAHRAEMQTLRRSLESHERERERLEESLQLVREKRAASGDERAALELEIERLDAATNPPAERRSALERERHASADRVAELEEAIRRHGSRKELLEARLRDIEETPGSRFVQTHRGRAFGLLRDLVHAKPGLERALVAALGPLADAVVYADEETAIADASAGDGAIIAIANGGPVAFMLPGERSLLSTVAADPPARGLVSTVLRDIYLAADIAEAAEKHRSNPKASFVTPEGVLVGQAVIHTAREADVRAREIRDELSVIAHDLSAARTALRPKRERMEAIGAELAQITEELEALDAEITAAAEAMTRLGTDLASTGKEEEIFAQRLAGLDEAAAAWRDALAAAGPVTHELPPLPPLPEPPISARVAVESLRRDRGATEAHMERLRAERDRLAAIDPAELRAAVAEAEARRAGAEGRLRAAGDELDAASTARNAAAASERTAAEAEAEVNRAWREASTELDRLREVYEEEDRLRGDLERRIDEARRLLREGHGRDPDEALAQLGEEDTVRALERKAELVQKRLGLLGRVNLLAGGEFESLQERHDFLARELDDVKKARRDLLEVIHRVEEEITTAFDAAFRDVAREFEALIADLFPGGEGRVVLTDPAEPLESGIEIEARPGRKRVKRISLLSGGERALTAMAFLFAIFKARPSPFYLMDEVEPALDDVNLARFLRLIQTFATESQVIIVTHQKRTMEVAEMMYGVSMSKDGTSRVVCQRLEHPHNGNGGKPAKAAPVTVPEPEAVG